MSEIVETSTIEIELEIVCCGQGDVGGASNVLATRLNGPFLKLDIPVETDE